MAAKAKAAAGKEPEEEAEVAEGAEGAPAAAALAKPKLPLKLIAMIVLPPDAPLLLKGEHTANRLK